MSFNIKQDENKVTINVNDIGENRDKLLESFNKCKEGSCECPTNEYSKLEGLDVKSTPDKITLVLTLKEKETINEKEISTCVDYSIKNAEN